MREYCLVNRTDKTVLEIKGMGTQHINRGRARPHVPTTLPLGAVGTTGSVVRLLRFSLIVSSLLAIPGFSEPSPKGRRLDGNNVIGLWLMGQSLCEGSQSLPIVTPEATGWGNLAFRRGVRTWIFGEHSAKPAGRADEQFTLVPLTAAARGGLGETIANGLADHLTATLFDSKQPSPTDRPGTRFLVAYAGQGGRLIDELSQIDQSRDPRTPESRRHGGGYYRTSLDDTRRARNRAQSLGKGFEIAALVWMQGEANGGPTGGIHPSRWDTELPRPEGQQWYRDRLIAYRKQWSHDLQAITGQKGEIPMFTYQTLGPAGEAQLMAADRDPHITMVGPHYMVPSGINSRYAGRYGDAIHLAADGERWYGEQVAKVVHRVLIDGEDWHPLRPLKARVDSSRSSVVIDFHVPRPPLMIDTRFLPRQQHLRNKNFSSNCGFKIRNATGDIPMIASVEVDSPTSIRIHLVEPLEKGIDYNLSYGLPYSGAIGTIAHLRKGPLVDEQDTTEILIPGEPSDPLRLLVNEGAFTAANTMAGNAYAQATIRHLYQENGSTVLRFENRELRNGVNFAVGQSLISLRPFPYGNLRDSDPEKAIYTFADDTYGKRAGQPYPLWNWCVLFNQFPVSEK